MTDHGDRDRSYNVRRTIPVGAHVIAVSPFMYRHEYPAGTSGVVLSYTNAGFRGIEANILLDDGTRVYNVCAGILTKTETTND